MLWYFFTREKHINRNNKKKKKGEAYLAPTGEGPPLHWPGPAHWPSPGRLLPDARAGSSPPWRACPRQPSHLGPPSPLSAPRRRAEPRSIFSLSPSSPSPLSLRARNATESLSSPPSSVAVANGRAVPP